MYFSFVFLLISILSLIYVVNSYSDTNLDDDFSINYDNKHLDYNEKIFTNRTLRNISRKI